MSKKKTTEQFIAEAKQVHGDKYDYSKVEYVNSSTKVCIICKECGEEFLQTPAHHLLRKQGCSNCAGNKKPSIEEFIEKAKQVHGDKYDYSKVEYKGNKVKICIICPAHGEFWQTPGNHLQNHGCPVCRDNILSLERRDSKEEFIEQAKQVHGDKYDYSKVEYVNNRTKVCIMCPEHGEFWQEPSSHLQGCGCSECGKEKIALYRLKTKEEFIEQTKQIHGDKYDYSKVEYVNTDTKVCIVCPDHGEFWQRPYSHLDGQGCPKCHNSHGERKIRQFLKKYNIHFESQKKFEDCRNIKPLPFDFYLPEYNLCVEFQGEQHYKPTEKFGGEEQFQKRQINDAIKKEWCSKKENPNLLEIKYNENIEIILKEKLNDIGNTVLQEYA